MDPSLLFFAALAVFLCYRLFTVLGTKGGHEPDEQDRVRPPAPPGAGQDDGVMPPPVPTAKAQPLWAEDIRAFIPDFDGDHFLTGAKAAYEMIVQAYASGTLDDIAPYVDETVLSAFSHGVSARDATGQSMEVTFVGIEKVDVERSETDGNDLQLVVSFQSDQIRVTRDNAGEVVDGDPNRIDLVKDIWTFSHPKQSNDPNWVLTATDAAASA